MPSNVKLATAQPIDQNWVATATGGPYPAELAGIEVAATVPGSIHTDLLAAGLIPDPYLDDNESLLRWIGSTDWNYRSEFEWRPDGADRVELVFAGLDTIAEISLNGATIGATRNMHRAHRFDVTHMLLEGTNTLSVHFSSPVRHADAESMRLGYRPHVNHHPYNAIRKMACSFGWDWGIDTSTSGIWKAVTLESFCTARLSEVRPIATPSQEDSSGTVSVHIKVARTGDAPLVISATIAGVTESVDLEPGETEGVVSVRLLDVSLWWPRGYGEQPLYDVAIELADGSQAGESAPLDSLVKRVGFRTVTLDVTPDSAGAPFTIVINGAPVFVKGANWIPDDAFPHRVDRARYARRLDQAEFANMNLLRVWGGGIYETEDFFDLCDERGILTWQDFLLACAAYSEDEPLYSEIEAEAREAVARISAHPSMILFNGNNENLWGFDEWGWKLPLDGKTWGEAYYHDLFPSIVAELAPQVGYIPGSPFSPDRNDPPNAPDKGSMHIWDLWNEKDYPHYRDYRPRFVAEFGWQGPPTWSTLKASIADDPLTPESPGMLVHQKAASGHWKLTDGLTPHFRLPNEIGAWHWAMSLNQAIAIRTAVEHFRSLAPHCSGSIVWQLNDCWPVTSWAAVDGYERAKPLLHALRGAYADRLVTIQPNGDGLDVVVINDTDVRWTSHLAICRLDFHGTGLATETNRLSVAPRATERIPVPAGVASPGSAESELIRAEFGNAFGDWFFADYRDSALAEPQLVTDLQSVDNGYRLTVEATNLVRDLTVLIDKVAPNATVDRGLVTLLPGERSVFTIVTHDVIAEGAVSTGEVLLSANQLVSCA